MSTEAEVRPSEALTEHALASTTKAVLLLTAELIKDFLFRERGSFGWLVFNRFTTYQPEAPKLTAHWPFFLGFLSSRNTNESVHLHAEAVELYGVVQGFLRLLIWDDSEWHVYPLFPGDFAVVKPGFFHYVEWEASAGEGWGFCVKAPHDPSMPGAKIVAPATNPAGTNGNGHPAASVRP